MCIKDSDYIILEYIESMDKSFDLTLILKYQAGKKQILMNVGLIASWKTKDVIQIRRIS